LSSKYPMLKYHADLLGTVTVNIGDTDKYVEFSHDLGYTPAFISYHRDGDYQYFIPTLGRNPNPPYYTYAWSNSTKVRCGISYNSPYGQATINESWSDVFEELYSAFYFFGVGNFDGNSDNGAIRFTNIDIPQSTSIISAVLNIAVQQKGGGTGDMKIKTFGIDEDNTSSFYPDSPMGRTQTSAVTTQNVSLPATGNYFGINVKDQVQEIVNRSGWSAGNAIGFLIYDNGSPTNVYINDDINGINSFLLITYNTGGAKTIIFRTVIFKDKVA
jgi:hypothetical protein